jgi:hypothetical protein
MRILLMYLKFPFTLIWLAMWSAPDRTRGETTWKSLRITIRYGEHHSYLRYVIKRGTI